MAKTPKLGVPVNASALSVSDESPDAYEGGSYVPLAPTPEEAPPAPSGMIRRVLGDGAVTALKGAIGVPEAAVGLADLVTGGNAGKMLENEGGAVGFRPKEAKSYLDQFYSPEQQTAFKRVQGAANPEDSMMKRILDTGVAAVKNPSVVAHAVGESLPAMGAGGLMGRAVLAAAPRMGAGVAAGLGEGTIAAGQGAESIRQETADGLLTGKQAGVAALSGVATAGLGIVAAKAAKSLGVGDIDTLIVGGKHVAPELQKGFVRRVLEGAFTEGVLEELPQSIQEQVAQNYALGKPIDEGVDMAAVMGALSGGAMGAGAQLIKRPPVGPLSRAADMAAGGIAPAAPAAPTAPAAPIALTPEQEAELLANANERKAALDLKAKGVKASEGVAEVAPQMLTPAEQFEQEFLSKAGGDAQALARTYGPLAPKPTDVAPIPEVQAVDEDAAIARMQADQKRLEQASLGRSRAAADDEEPPDEREFVAAAPAEPDIGDDLPMASQDDILNPAGEPFKERFAAKRALTRQQDPENYVIAQVQGGYVLRRNAQAAAAPAAAPAPAPAVESDDDATMADILDSDILNPAGAPFKERAAAIAAQKKSGGELVQVAGGWVVRAQPTELGASTTVQPAGTRGTSAADVVPSGSSTTRSHVGEKIDDEWTAFAPETGTLGRPRADMPQIRAEHRGAMTNFLNARGITHETGIEVDPKTLKPTQAEFSPAKVQKAVDFGNEDRSILVSSDGHVLDGHHQWVAKLEAGQPVKIIRLNAPIARLLEEVSQFPSAEVSQGSTTNEPTEPTQATPEDAPEGGQAPTPTGGDATGSDAAGSPGVPAEPQAGDDEAAGVAHAFKVGDSVTFSPSRGTKSLEARVIGLRNDDVRIKLLASGNELTVPHDFLRAKAAPAPEPEVAPQPPVAEPEVAPETPAEPPVAEPTGGTPTGDVAPKDEPVEEPTEEEAPVAERPDALIELRRELSVLNKLRACLKT